MEMIAMLGGLGATKPGFSPEGAAFASQISATKNVEELMVVVAAIDSASLRPDEKSALKVIAMEKRDSFDSIFRKPWYWVTVAAVLGVAWWKRDAIKRVVGLNGLGGTREEHRPRMEKAIAAGRQHLKEFHEALDKRHACRSSGRTSGADEKLFDAIASLARAEREAEHAGVSRSTNQALVDLDGDVDSAQIDFARRCVVTEPLDVRPMVPASLIRR